MNKINTISGLNLPRRLRDIPDAPNILFFRGMLPDESLPAIAIVGTRKPTSYGRQATEQIASGLAARGAIIVSGLAHGVDGIAHRATLKAGGKTVAVLPSGLDSPYPSAHRGLAEDIVTAGGALISEYAPGTPAMQHNFLRRNRLVIGMADLLVVTEAALRSGTMNTTSHALAQGKDVYVVPGNITSPMSAGCNALITQGAFPITDIDEFIEKLFPRAKSRTVISYSDAERQIVELLENGVTDGDILQRDSGLDATEFLQTITMLEINGSIKSLGNNKWGL